VALLIAVIWRDRRDSAQRRSQAEADAASA
jgi:hypothetical protein